MRPIVTSAPMLAGRVAVITGAGRGIGAAIARRLADHGAVVITVDIDADSAAGTAESIRVETGSPTESLGLDVTDESAVEEGFDGVVSRHGQLDCVVVNAGVLHLAHVVDMELPDWKRVLDVNLTGAFLTARAAARRMTEGSIVMISSLFGRRGGVENAAYSASKFGLIGLAECLAAEMAGSGVRVNSVCPGQISTEMVENLAVQRAEAQGSTPEMILERLVARVPMGRMGEAAEVADVCVFLASDLSRYLTGQSIVVDGGWQVG